MAILNYLFRLNKIFLIIVVLPCAISIIYNGFIYSDKYISQSRFVVKSPSLAQPTLGSLIQGMSPTNPQDALVVQSYIQSRDAMTTLDRNIGLRSIYESPNIDIFHRFPLYGERSLEEFYNYYQKFINVEVDPTSSVVTLTVIGFDKSKVTKINEALLKSSENLVNQLNDRMEVDLVESARLDVANTEKQFLKAGSELNAFQLNKGIIDPEKEAALEKERVGKMQDALIEAQAHLAEIQSISPNSPQIKPLQQRISALQKSATETQKSAVAGGDSLMAHSADYTTRKVNQDLAVQELTSASQRLQAALLEASRRQIYFDRVAQPSQPDDSIEPQRIINILVTVIISLVTWGIIELLVAGFREHYE